MEADKKAGQSGTGRKTAMKLWFTLNILLTMIYLTWRIFFTIPYQYGWVSIVAGVFLLVVEVLGMVESFVHFANMYDVKGYTLPEVRLEDYPDVDIFVCTYNEEPELLYKTLNGCKHIKYPDRSKVHIYLCDDGHREEMRQLADRMGVLYLDRPDHKGQKAGNLNNAMAHSSSPLVVTLDADMIPRSNFLMKTVPYFVDAEYRNRGREESDKIKLCMVQTPQSFYNPDLFQYNLFSEKRIPNEQDYFYRDIQVARTRTNSVIYGGSNTVLLRKAIEDVGGFYMDAITEDFATGILMEKKGYVTLGVGEPLASGLSPTDLQNLVQQRVRWARGVISTARKMHILTNAEMSFAQKMNYWASMWYWYAPLKRLIYIMAPILYATFHFQVVVCTLPQVLLFWLPMFVVSNITLRMLSGNVRNSKWTGVYETVLFPYMLIPVLLESVGVHLKKFKVTSKSNKRVDRKKELVFSLPFILLIVLSVIGIVNCISIMFMSGSLGPIVVLFWLVFNLFMLVMALFFTNSRMAYRKSERAAVEAEAVVSDAVRTISCYTRDVSEQGLSIILDKPHYFENPQLTVQITSGEYAVKMRAEIVFVSQRDKMWNYSLKIVDYLGCYDTWLQIIYDRIPVMPQQLKRDSGVYEDLKLNTTKRLTRSMQQKRHLPRIAVNAEVPCDETPDHKVYLKNFNYLYAAIGVKEEKKRKNQNREPEQPEEILPELTVHLSETVILELTYHQTMENGTQLYYVKNFREYVDHKKEYGGLLDRLMEMMHSFGENQTLALPQEPEEEFSEIEIVK